MFHSITLAIDENLECCARKFRNLDVDKMILKLGLWQKVYETWLLTESLWNLDVDRKVTKNGCWQKVYETWMLAKVYEPWMDVGWQKVYEAWMLTISLCNLDNDKKFMQLECYQKAYETRILTESLWNSDVVTKIWSLYRYINTDWTMSMVVHLHA